MFALRSAVGKLPFFNAIVEVRNQRVHIDAVSAGAFADRFEVGCHAAYAAQTVSIMFVSLVMDILMPPCYFILSK